MKSSIALERVLALLDAEIRRIKVNEEIKELQIEDVLGTCYDRREIHVFRGLNLLFVAAKNRFAHVSSVNNTDDEDEVFFNIFPDGQEELHFPIRVFRLKSEEEKEAERQEAYEKRLNEYWGLE
jgi:hypothetical protein